MILMRFVLITPSTLIQTDLYYFSFLGIILLYPIILTTFQGSTDITLHLPSYPASPSSISSLSSTFTENYAEDHLSKSDNPNPAAAPSHTDIMDHPSHPQGISLLLLRPGFIPLLLRLLLHEGLHLLQGRPDLDPSWLWTWSMKQAFYTPDGSIFNVDAIRAPGGGEGFRFEAGQQGSVSSEEEVERIWEPKKERSGSLISYQDPNQCRIIQEGAVGDSLGYRIDQTRAPPWLYQQAAMLALIPIPMIPSPTRNSRNRD